MMMNSCSASGEGKFSAVFCVRFLFEMPSSRNSFWVLRPPATVIVGPERLCDTIVGAVTLITPGTTSASAIALRPFNGNSCILVRSTSSLTAVDRVSTPVDSAFTVTLWLTSPTASTTSTRAFWSTSSVMPCCTNLVKPVFCATTLYSPTGRFVIRYAPEASELVEREKEVSTFSAVTCVSGITAPLLSLTIPTSEAVVV